MSEPLEILVVCSGNICRSPYAEGYVRHRLRALGRAATVRSAGTLGIDGSPASAESVQLAREDGFDIAGHRSRGIRFEHLDEADAVLVMEKEHRSVLVRQFPEGAGKIELLARYHPSVGDPESVPDIFDPIGRSVEEYRRCFALVRAALDGFLESRGLLAPS